MAILPIVTGEDQEVLRTKTEKIPKVTKDIQKLIKDMQQTVQDADGAGLAAPQIGKSLRLCLALIEGKYMPLINPDITWKSEETDVMEEGCLSLPGIWKEVERPTSIIIKYQNEKGEEQERKLNGMPARIVLHEIDHLDGVLITDYMSPQRGSKEMAL